MNKYNPTKNIISADIGNAASKLIINGKAHIIPTNVNHGNLNDIATATHSANTPQIGQNAAYTNNNIEYIAGPDVPPCATKNHQWYTGPQRTIALHHACQQAKIHGIQNITATIPPYYYWDQAKQKQTQTILQLENTLKVPTTINNQNSKPLKFLKVSLIAEGFAAALSLIINSNGKINNKTINKTILVIDIGGGDTTIVAVKVDEKGNISTPLYTTKDLGQLHYRNRVREQLNQRINTQTGQHIHSQDITETKLIQAIKDQNIIIQNQKITLQDIITNTDHWFKGQINNTIHSVANNISLYDQILLTGGYIQTLQDQKQLDQWFPNQITTQNPILDNAQGAYNLAKFRNQ